MLSHAEIESYLEDWAKDIARASEVLWNAARKVTNPFAFLVATHSERIGIPATLVGPSARDGPQRLIDASVKVFQRYYKQLKENNGIKEKNVLALFTPLGVSGAALGSTLLPNLDNLGALRGTHAHQSAKAVRTVLDPETEYKRVASIVDELEPVDQWLARYKRGIR